MSEPRVLVINTNAESMSPAVEHRAYAVDKAMNLVKSFEGWSATPYYCPAGVLTIGYGHAIKKGENFTTISKDVGESILCNDLLQAYVQSTRISPILLNQSAACHAAIVDFIYNLGITRYASSTLCRLINQGKLDLSARELVKWVHGGGKVLPGLVKRRAVESSLLLL